jgi:formyl-CoA transferase
MGHLPASSALSRLTVIDLSHVRAGPVAVRQLGDWGANVIKIERPGDPGDFAGRHEADFQHKHRNKRGIALDLKKPEGVAVLMKMVAQADIVVENYRPDVKKRLGIDYESMRKVNPRIIYCSISAFGQDGPYKDRPGVDQIIQGLAGFMSINGEAGRGPMRAGIPLSDIAAGLFGALGILVALYEREQSGEGQWVQTSLLESQTFMLDLQAVRYLVENTIPKQSGNGHPTGVATNAYKTTDGYINIAPLPAHWDRLCRAIGREDLINHPDYKTKEQRRGKRKEIDDLITSITSEVDSATMLARLDAADVPAGRINTIDQVFDDPQMKHLAMTQTVDSPKLGTITLMGQPVRLSRTPSKLTRACPEFAQHTDELLAEFGYGADDIKRLRADGIAE